MGREFIFERGRDDFRSGRPRPICPPDEDFNPCTDQAVRWLGYMVERGKDYMDRKRIAEQLNCDPETVQPRA